jgi:hypothetical protein
VARLDAQGIEGEHPSVGQGNPDVIRHPDSVIPA